MDLGENSQWQGKVDALRMSIIHIVVGISFKPTDNVTYCETDV